jgi:hypothetical protein
MLIFTGMGIMSADDKDEKDNDSSNGQQLFDAQLLRVADLNVPAGNPPAQPLGPSFAPNGTDPLDKGRVMVLRNRKVQFELRGATRNVSYNAFFCRFGFSPAAGCVAMAGTLNTNTQGNAEGLLSFPEVPAGSSNTWAGAFIITRTIAGAATNEYVTGFALPSKSPGGIERNLSGRIAALNKSKSSFTLAGLPLDILTGPQTQYENVRSFSDLAVGMDVEVRGLTNPDGSIYAMNVKAAPVVVVVPPVISGVQATNITSSSATVTWATNVASNSQVEFGTTTSYGGSTPVDPAQVTAHTVNLSGLAASTPYHYRVKSSDASGAQAVSGDFTFTTLALNAGFTLTASPASVTLGAAVTVNWIAPAGRPSTDRIGFYAMGASNQSPIWSQSTNGAASGNFTMTPGQTGQFEFRYLQGNTDIIRSNTVNVTNPVYTLNATPASVTPGGALSVAWTAPAGRPATDSVGLFAVGAANTAPVWVQSTNGTASGSINTAAPAAVGIYEFRYLLQGSTDIVRSNPVSVAVAGYTLTATPANTNPGGAVTVAWTAPAGAAATDWVGLFQVGAPNSPAIWFQYTNGLTSGSATASVPEATGLYEFRYLLQNGYTDVIHSNTISSTLSGNFTIAGTPRTVSPGGTLTVSWTAPSGRPANDWVGLYLVGAPNSPSIWFQYTNGTTSGSITLNAPGQPGQYEFRYLLMDRYMDVARSAPVTVQ